MKSGEPSETAIVSAAFRAAHAYVYAGPAIHVDTFALALLGIEDAETLRRGFEATGTPALPEASAHFALRHRFSEELLTAAIKDGVRQVVLLGAGLDSFALRHPDVTGDLDFFEVDHPDTQSWKLERIAALELERPDIQYLSIDFETEDLRDVLSSGGLDFSQRVFFSWLGATHYIDRAAVARTLGILAEAGSGSQFVLDFIVASEELDEHARSINTTYGAASASRGEPWITSYSPAGLVRELEAVGFGNVTRLTPEEAGRRYYQGQPADVVPMQGWQLVHATV